MKRKRFETFLQNKPRRRRRSRTTRRVFKNANQHRTQSPKALTYRDRPPSWFPTTTTTATRGRPGDSDASNGKRTFSSFSTASAYRRWRGACASCHERYLRRWKESGVSVVVLAGMGSRTRRAFRSFVRSFARGTRGGVIFFTTPRRRRASRIASSSSLRTHGSRASSKGGSDESRRGEERSRGRRVGVSECPRNSYCGYLFIIFYTFVYFVHACRFFLFTRWMVFEGVLIRDRRGCGRRAPASVGDGRTSGTGRRADDDGGAG